jgi:hypothetical protein
VSESPSIRVESDRVAFEMADGKMLRLPASFGTFHDQEGVVLPKCSVFFGNYKKTGRKVEMSRSDKRYYGGSYKAQLATLPKIPISGWIEIGPVAKIFYVRKGPRASGGYHHPFAAGHQPVLFKSGRLYRLDLGSNCLVDDRGYRWPVIFLFVLLEYVLRHCGWLIGA